MPEGDTIFRAARTLQTALAGKTITAFQTVLPKLARVNEDTPVPGRIVESVGASGKWIEMRFSGDLILLTHMLMSGSWHIYRAGEAWKRSQYDMRIVVATADFVAVAFRVPVAEFHSPETLRRRAGFRDLGPALLRSDFDGAEAMANLRAQPEMEIGSALIRQWILAGIGNVFKSEVCFAGRVNPFRKVGSLNDSELGTIVSEADRLLKANVLDTSEDKILTYTGFRRTTGMADASARLWVYGRARRPCRVCGTAILARRQGSEARLTFWCPRCQPFALQP
ncbi:MAG TPA: DNA-formamidopyrimidine glycosylase family protein [Bryobacteraceae bacterium]|jgi:endonuclease-8|nr:DNA-formamidopyrimidine glycosylase family protein [Bryobacteraceae bacterium]